METNVKLTAVSMACALLLGTGMAARPAHAQTTEDMRRQIDAMQQQIEALKAQMDQMSKQQASAAPAPAAPAAAGGGEFLQRKAGKGMTFLTRGGEITAYGNLDLSLDSATKGINGKVASDGSTPAGNGGWMWDISSNISYVGLRGFQSLGDYPAHFVWQLETQIDVSATSGTGASNSNTSSAVKGGLTSRNSFIGLASAPWGAVKIGKTDAPYKTSTNIMNPFSGMWGDYSVIMGNTGGDNRVEFGTRFDHALWYESPSWGGFSFNALVSPGQNRAYDNSNLAAGEGDCAGGNVPGSGGGPVACNDGAFGTAYSLSAGYHFGPLYLTAAYEHHSKVNRTGDLAAFDPNDVADERAAKVGAQYHFGSTTISGIYENMKRNVPDYLAFQNERSRSGTWLAVSQALNAKDSLHFGWAHANKTPGDPGTHNTDGGANPDNSANMFTLAWKHKVDENFSWYVDYATTINHPDAHYDLGAGGRSVTTDCHDASNPDSSGFDPNGGAPKCWAGGHLQGVSVGMKYQF
ncbi:porin [Ramlibacter ginsenosidimutans]|uniref:Porin n=1 Tax=Ramlibacter ginsenosidimutans TaxID=502333 RepID=A0A934WQ08_9BURK|nr:porin [Ramlibacter ginsenosidimutans]